MNITATAARWEHGWELSLNGEVVTQVSTLDKAAQQVRDYLDTIDPDVDHSEWAVDIAPELGDLAQRISNARRSIIEAGRMQEEAARASRSVARELREAGISVTDSAAILGVSRGRVSQLVNS